MSSFSSFTNAFKNLKIDSSTQHILDYSPQYGALTSSQREIWLKEEALSEQTRHARLRFSPHQVVQVKDIDDWQTQLLKEHLPPLSNDIINELDDTFNKKIALYRGDITRLAFDGITNAANTGLLGGGGVDGAIHRNAGPALRQECESLLRPGETGRTKITRGHCLPAKFVLHSIGPVGEKPGLLKSCYDSALKLCQQHQLKTIAFPAISAGAYGYDIQKSSPVVLEFIREWLSIEENRNSIDLIAFVVFSMADWQCYHDQMVKFFPLQKHDGSQLQTNHITNEDNQKDQMTTSTTNENNQQDQISCRQS